MNLSKSPFIDKALVSYCGIFARHPGMIFDSAPHEDGIHVVLHVDGLEVERSRALHILRCLQAAQPRWTRISGCFLLQS
jgi:hypothetical protein